MPVASTNSEKSRYGVDGVSFLAAGGEQGIRRLVDVAVCDQIVAIDDRQGGEKYVLGF